MILLGAAVSALFANDGAALILTPIVIAMLTALRFSPASTLAFVMAAGFIADTASLPMVVSNLVNIVSADFFGVGFGEYASVMWPVNLVAVAATLFMLWMFYRKDIPARYDANQLEAPESVIRDRATFLAGWWVLCLLLVGLFALEPLGIPISAVAAACAVILLVISGKGHPGPWACLLVALTGALPSIWIEVWDTRPTCQIWANIRPPTLRTESVTSFQPLICSGV